MSDNKDSLPKVPQQIGDPISENLQKLAQLFPGVVKDGELDVEALREELGDFAEIQPGDEKYELNWAGKQAAKKKAFQPLLGKTLKYLAEDSKDPETTKNIYLEGDNLEGLKLIRHNYYGAISIIYIDPPYNTGKDFVYKDNYKADRTESDQAEGAISESGERLFKNEKSSNRFHANWLDMMYPRLKLAKDLLREDGVVFISIDDNEVHNLREIGDEIFGPENFVSTLPTIMNLKGNNDQYGFSGTHEFTVVYIKNKSSSDDLNGIPLCDEDKLEYSESDDKGAYKQGATLMRTGEAGARVERPRGYYPIYVSKDFNRMSLERLNNDDYEVFPKTKDGQEMSWRRSPNKLKDTINDFIIKKTASGISFYKKQRLEDDLLKGKKAKSLFYKPDYSSGNGTSILKDLFGGRLFNNPKPTQLLKDFISIGSHLDSLILDFFSGSATTAHAVLQLNAEDGGTRKHISVQLHEECAMKSEAAKVGYKTIAEIGKERIRRAGDKIKAELVEKSKSASEEEKKANPYLANPDALDIGFKSFRIEDTKINWLKKDLSGGELVDVDISDKDRLDFVPGFTDLDVVYEIMLRQSSIPLTEPISTLTDIGPRTYLYGESYLICLEEDITKEMVEKLAQLEPTPLKFIFRDSAFGKDIAFKDTTFRRLNAEIAKHTEGEETYTVEFI